MMDSMDGMDSMDSMDGMDGETAEGSVGAVVLTWARQDVVMRRILPALGESPDVAEIVVLNHSAEVHLRPPVHQLRGQPVTAWNTSRPNALGQWARLMAAEMLCPRLRWVLLVDDDQVIPAKTVRKLVTAADNHRCGMVGLVPRWWRDGTLYGPKPDAWRNGAWGTVVRCDFALTGGLLLRRDWVPDLLRWTHGLGAERKRVRNAEDLALVQAVWDCWGRRPLAVKEPWVNYDHKREALHSRPGHKRERDRWVREMMARHGDAPPWGEWVPPGEEVVA